MLYAQPVGAWKEQPIEIPVRGLMGISMSDTGTGYAVGDVDVIRQQTGILVKKPGDPTWHPVPANVFSPPITIALSSWAQDVHAVPNSGTAFISWRDDYRSLVYKTADGGATWYSVSPLNPILYGIRYAINFINAREGMIVGEGPGRVHRTLDGGVSWTSYSIPANPPLTDVKFTGSYWVVAAGQNTFFRFNPANQRWFDLSFIHSAEYFPTHLKTHFVNDNYGYLTGYNQNNPLHVMKTTNGGNDWDPVVAQPPFNSNPEGHKGVFFFDSLKGWVSSAYDEFAYTEDGGHSWSTYPPQVFGGKPYMPVNKMIFLNEAFGWAVGGVQRTDGYPSVSYGWIMKWTGTQKPDISTTPVYANFDTMACQTSKDIIVPVHNTGTGGLTILAGGVTFSQPEFSLRNVTWPVIIASGDTHEFEVRWEPAPNDYGPPPANSQMIIQSSDNEHTPWNISLYGDRKISRLVPLGSTLLFPRVCQGERSIATFPVGVFGNISPKIIKVEIFSDRGTLELLSHNIGDVITGPDSLSFALSSSRAGSITGNVLITAGNPDCPDLITIPFQGMIQSNTMEVTPTLVQFKDVCVGDDVVQYVQVKNVGTVRGRIQEFVQYGGDSLFVLEVDTSLTIEQGQYVLLALRFNPKKADSLSSGAQFRLIFSPCPDTLLLACTGRGVAAFMELKADSILVVGPAPLDRSISTTVPLSNIGFLPTIIEEVFFDPPVPGLQLTAPLGLPKEIKPKEVLDVSFTYQASSRDSIWTTLRYRWSDPCAGDGEQLVLLISDEMPIAEVTDVLVFKTETCEEDVPDSVQVSNTGQKPLTIFTATVIGSNSTHFRVTGPKLPLTIDPGKSAWLYLAYNSPVNGGSTATLVINHNDLTVRGESRVQLSGRKKVNALTVVGDTLGMLKLCRGIQGTRQFLLRNDNAEVLFLSSITLMSGNPYVTTRSAQVPTSVQPGGTFDLWVDVTLPKDTVITVQLRVMTDPCNAEYTLRFKAGVIIPNLTVLPDPLALGTLPVSDTSTVAVRIFNSDSIDVVVDSLIVSGATSALYLAQQLTAPRRLLPGESLGADLKLRLVKDTGSISGTLCAVVSSPCPDTICFDITGHFVGTPFAFSADTLRYTFAFCDTLLCDTVRITNALTVPQLLQPAIGNNAIFSVEPDTAVLLEAGEGVTFRICARKPVLSITRGELLLQSNAAPLTAVALVAVRQDQGLILPDTVYAGNIPVCESERVFSIPIDNSSGLAEIVLDASSSDAAFSMITPLPLSINGNSSDTLKLRFRPAGPGIYTADLTIHSRSAKCDRTTIVRLTGKSGESFIAATPSTLLFANVVAGSAQSKTLNILNLDMEGLRLAAIAVQPSAQFSAAAATPVAIPPGSSVDISVLFLADNPGNYFGSLCLIFDRPCPDTICVSLEGIAIDGDLVFTLPRLQFDSLAYCEEEIDTVLLRNSGNANILLKAANINGSGAAGYTLLNPITADEPLSAGTTRPFYLRFRSADVPDGSATASLFVTTDAPAQPTLELPLFGTRVRYAIPPEIVLTLGQVLLGSTINLQPSFTNTGDSRLEMLSIVLPGDYQYLGVGLPYTVGPGWQEVIPLVFNPSREGTIEDTILVPLGPCGGEIRVIVRCNVLRQFVQTNLDFGDVPFCETRSGLVTMLNNGTTPIQIEKIWTAGAGTGTCSILNPPALPYMLNPSAQLVLTVEFTPTPGMVGPTNMWLMSEVRIDGQLVRFQSDLTAMVRDGGLEFSGTTFLGSGELGTEYTGASLVGRNTSSFPVSVAEILMPSPQLRLLSATPAPPVEIAPGDSMVIELAFIPATLGITPDSIQLRYSAPCAATLSVPVSYEGYGDRIPLTVIAGSLTGVPDATVDIPILLSRDITGFNITAWQSSLRFNASMLYPLAVISDGTLSQNMQLTSDYNQIDGVISITASNGRLSGSGDVLAFVRCLVLVGNDSSTVLQPEAATFSHPALLIDSYQTGRFDLEGYCLAHGRRLLGSGEGLLLGPAAPNPAITQSRMRVTLPVDGEYTLSLHDAGGRCIAVISKEYGLAGAHDITFDCTELPSGNYLVVLRSGNGIATQKMTVLR